MKLGRFDRWVARATGIKVVDLPDGEVRLILDHRPPPILLRLIQRKGYRLNESGGWYTIERAEKPS